MIYDRDGTDVSVQEFTAQIVERSVSAVFSRARPAAVDVDGDESDFLAGSFEDAIYGAPLWVSSAPTTPAAAAMTPAEIAAEIAVGVDPWAVGAHDRTALRADAPPASHLVSALVLSQFVDSPHLLWRLFEPGAVTHLICPSTPLRRVLDGVAADITAIWSELLENEGRATNVDWHVLEPRVVPERQRADMRRMFESDVEASLRNGRAVFVVTARGEDLPSRFRALSHRQLHWPGLTRATVIEVLKRTHSTTGKVAEEALSQLLPSETVLRRVEPLQLDVACQAPTTVAVAQRVAEIARAQAGNVKLTLNCLKGIDEVRAPLDRMRRDLDEWREGRTQWRDVTASAVLHGPPGTGKTTLASALAGSADVPLIATSYSDCQKAGHQGDMLAALCRAFAEAATASPSVLFIGELDSFSVRGAGRDSSYMRGVVNGLLEQINNIRAVEGVILIGATNDLGAVDPAVVRSGRFDLKLPVLYPGREGLHEILAERLGPHAARMDLAAVAKQMVGQSGATVEALVRDALGRARAEGIELGQRHLEQALDEIAPAVATEWLRRFAIHEAGHVLVTLLSPLPTPTAVRITAQGGEVEQRHLPLLTPKLARARLRMLLAGRAAEICVCGTPSSGAGTGAASDLALATDLALKIERQWGFGTRGLRWQQIDARYTCSLPPSLEARVEALLQRAESEALDQLRLRMPTLLALTDRLLRHRELDGDALERLRSRMQRERGVPEILTLPGTL